MTTKNNQLQKTGTKEVGMTAKSLFDRDDVKKRFYDMLGRRADQFMTSVLQVVASNDLLQKADPMTIYQSAAMAATLDLPLNNNIGVAYIIPYNTRQKDGSFKTVAQFQIGYKGFIQLAIRSGQFKRIEVCKVYENDEEKDVYDRLTSFFKKGNPEGKVIGYASYFQLLNGFEKTHYMSNEELKQHAGKYSQTAKKGFGLWKDDYESMATKGLAIDTDIKTANKGWVKMGDIVKGDIVYDDNGREVEVLAVSERKHIECYKIIFSNGEEVVCDREHDWVVRVGSTYTPKKLNIVELYNAKLNGKQLSIKTTSIAGKRKDLPIDPYCFGYWIGNGSRRHANVTTSEEDVGFIRRKYEQAGYVVSTRKDTRSNAVCLNISRKDKSVRTGGLKEQLMDLGVLENKHIPEIYEFASFEQRLELIKGLFDSDGCNSIRKQGTPRASFTQTGKRKHIVESVYRILCSLGEQPSRIRKVRAHGYGKYVTGYVVQLTCKNNLFAIPRKASKWRKRQSSNSWGIKEIQKVDPVETVCIAVDSPSHTYLCTKSQIPTHNTVLKLLLSKYAPLSVEMQKAVLSDQAVIHDAENDTVEYVDNSEVIQDAELVAEKKEYDRVSEFIEEARKEKDIDKLMMAEDHLHTPELQTLFDNAKKEIEG